MKARSISKTEHAIKVIFTLWVCAFVLAIPDLLLKVMHDLTYIVKICLDSSVWVFCYQCQEHLTKVESFNVMYMH